MSIKLDVNINDFIVSHDCLNGYGDLVFAWDEDKYSLVVGVHLGFEDKYDESTGDRIKHSHIVEVWSWTEPSISTFKHARSYAGRKRPRVITPDGTGRFAGIDRSGLYIVIGDDGETKSYPRDKVKLFTWSLVDAKDTNDKPTT